jgi:hypothetical protein
MHIYSAFTSSDVSVTTAATTILQIATPSTRRAKIIEAWVSFNSVTATDVPGLVELVQATSNGTSSAMTPVAWDRADPAALCAAAITFTVEPTGPTVLMPFKQSPIGTTLIYQIPLGVEIEMLISSFVGIRLTCPQAESGIRALIKFQE